MTSKEEQTNNAQSQNEDPQESLARLSIPEPKKSEFDLIWRLRLIKKEGIFPHDQLINALSMASKGKLTESIKADLIRTAKSEDMQLDEVDRTKLFATTLLLNSKKLSPETIVYLDRTSRRLAGDTPLKKYAKENSSYVEHQRSNFLSLGHAYIKKEIPYIRSKLAFQEIITTICPNEMLPFMVSISPRYLTCEFSRRWINVNQYHAQYGETPHKEKARLNLKNLAKSIQSPNYTKQKRRYSYWKLNFIYEDLSQKIDGFREHVKEKKFDKELFNIFCDVKKIPETYIKLILNPKIAPKQLALEIMTKQGHIKDPKTLKDFQSKISKLRKKHSYAEIMLIVEDFLDLPTTSPEMLAKLDHLAVLERVRL